ncbi:MAG TPA: hypothetical protein VMT81_00090 [Candidatus Paceibacterota bacterium]|nr:hypothetical protein [Candidatus Paceibacterota bacterium]
MDFAPVYLVQRFLYRIGDFFHHWYVHGSRAIGNQLMVTLEAADQTFAVKITLRHFFEPLYKDYSIIGRILGVVFRTGRVIIGGAVYLVIAICFAAAYLVWLAIPAAILWYVVTGKV